MTTELIRSMLLAGTGGFVGTCCRYLTGRWCASLLPGHFPLGTLAVNILGCFLIGIFYGLLDKARVLSPSQSLLLITGFCGGFTTYSAFADDLWRLAHRGEWSMLILYLGATFIIGILVLIAGRALVD